MVNEDSPQGLVFHKLDLHVHTPASRCFKDKEATEPEEIIEKACEEQLSAIAITDHNSGEWIDRIKVASKGKLIIFPGVEISAVGGRTGVVHIIGIFDPSKTTKDIENLLGALHISADKYGAQDAFTRESPSKVIDKIVEHDGLPLLPHANSEKGVMGGMSGIPRTDIILNDNLAGAEAPESDFNNEEKKTRRVRVCDLLDGSSPYRKMAVFQASDNPSDDGSGRHSVEGIGKEYSYFKLDEITLEGLRQCFCDPDVRIKLKDASFNTINPSIECIAITGGFLDGETVGFHDGLNSIVGGKGSGKSLIVEFLRFALNQTSAISSVMEDNKGKLKEQLTPFGKIEVKLKLSNGETYLLTRTYDCTNNPCTCLNMRTGEEYLGSIEALFPILAYSQNEVIRIAENGDAQLELIDSFIDSSGIINSINKLNEKLHNLEKDLSKSIKASTAVKSLDTELKTTIEKIKNIDIVLNNALFVEMKALENKKVELEKHLTFIDSLSDAISQTKTNIQERLKVPDISESLIKDDLVVEFQNISKNSLRESLVSLDEVFKTFDQTKIKMQLSFNGWKQQYEEKKKQYLAALAETGNNQRKLEIERQILESRKTDLNRELEAYTTQLERLDTLKRMRLELLNGQEISRKLLYETRKQKYEDLTTQSNERLRLSIEFATNPESFLNELVAWVKGSGIRKDVCERISKRISPSKFTTLIIENDFETLARLAEIDEENAKKVLNNLNAKDALEDVLSLAYQCYPQDVPKIEFRKEDEEYYPLSGLSVGQKCSALLIIALSEGDRPIIIDQPEDSLDTSSIYKDIVSKLRLNKEKRQFILTTHNSSVGVASDSDNFIILKSDANHGALVQSGAIDRQPVKNAVIGYLEGGPEPYALRNQKYNIRPRKDLRT